MDGNAYGNTASSSNTPAVADQASSNSPQLESSNSWLSPVMNPATIDPVGVTESGFAAQIFDLELRRVYVQAALAAERKVHGANPEVCERLEARLSGVANEIARIRDRVESSLPDEKIKRILGINDDDIDFLWTATAMGVDLGTLPHAIALIGSDARRGPTLLLHAVIADIRGRQGRDLAVSFSSSHPLIRSGILAPTATDLVLPATPLPVSPRVVSFLRGQQDIDSLLEKIGGVVTVPSDMCHDAVQKAAIDQLAMLVVRKGAMIAMVCGSFGSGRRTAIAAAAKQHGRSAVHLEARRAGEKVEDFEQSLLALRREAILRNAVPIVSDIDELPKNERDGDVLLRTLINFAETFSRPVFFTSKSAGFEFPLHVPLLRVNWPVPETDTRIQLWKGAINGYIPDIDPDTLLEIGMRYRMGAGGIEAAVDAARLSADTHQDTKGSLNASQLIEGVRSSVADRLGSLATCITVRQDWNDLILAPDTLTQVKSVVARIRHAHKVYEQWGFRSKMPRGIGVSVLFSGPPGTGKTMVAGLIAKDLELELYQVDLSKIVSKWVGETEKNLGKIFDATEAGHALLLFDEADSLFAKRTEVKGSNDRYANMEVNYLLQRVESFGGVTILTTNLETSIDDALKRRLSSHVVFWRPDIEERIALWQRLIPKDAPIANDIDFEKLANKYTQMSGAHIRNAVLSGAFLAAGEGGTINHDVLDRAARAEYQTMGHVL